MNIEQHLGKITEYADQVIFEVFQKYISKISSKFDLSKNYFFKAKTRNSISILNQYIANALYIWSDLNKSNLDAAQTNFNQLDQRFDNIRKIQNVFLNCYFESINTVSLYEELISNSKTDFSRYNYFYAKYLENNGKKDKAKKKKTIF